MQHSAGQCLNKISAGPQTHGIGLRCGQVKQRPRRAAGNPARWYGLENSNVTFEYVPLFTKFKSVDKMQRIAPDERP